MSQGLPSSPTDLEPSRTIADDADTSDPGSVALGGERPWRHREAVLFSVSDTVSVDGYEATPQRYQMRLLSLAKNGTHYTSEYPILVVPVDSGFAALASAPARPIPSWTRRSL